jgi:hypothetical protein
VSGVECHLNGQVCARLGSGGGGVGWAGDVAPVSNRTKLGTLRRPLTSELAMRSDRSHRRRAGASRLDLVQPLGGETGRGGVGICLGRRGLGGLLPSIYSGSAINYEATSSRPATAQWAWGALSCTMLSLHVTVIFHPRDRFTPSSTWTVGPAVQHVFSFLLPAAPSSLPHLLRRRLFTS